MAIQTEILPAMDIELPETGLVTLTIKFGYNQIGGSNVKFAGEDVALAKGKVKDLELGEADQLKGRTLIVKSRILDSNLSTNKVSTTHVFSSAKNMPVVKQGMVAADGDIMEYIFTYTFI